MFGFGRKVVVTHGFSRGVLHLGIENNTDKDVIPEVKSSKGTSWILPVLQVGKSQNYSNRPGKDGPKLMAVADLFAAAPNAKPGDKTTVTVTFRVGDNLAPKLGKHTFEVTR